jgi:hypothetical protein
LRRVTAGAGGRFPQEALLCIESAATDALAAFHSNQQVFTDKKSAHLKIEVSKYLLISSL